MFAAEVPQTAASSPMWAKLVSTLQAFGNSVGPLSAAIDAATAAGGTLRPEVRDAYAAWLSAAERLKQRAADLIEKDPKLQAVLETAGAGFAGFGRIGELEAYFAEVTSNVKRIIDLLSTPLLDFTPVAPVVGLGQAVQVASWAARFAGPLWQGLIALLRTPAVAVAGGAAVAAQGLDNVLNAEVETYYGSVEKLRKLCFEKKLTVEECKALEPERPTDWKSAVIWGGISLGALAIWLNRRKTALAGLGIRAKTRYKRRWRTS